MTVQADLCELEFRQVPGYSWRSEGRFPKSAGLATRESRKSAPC